MFEQKMRSLYSQGSQVILELTPGGMTTSVSQPIADTSV